MKTLEVKPDVEVANNGSIVVFYPATTQGEVWIKENVAAESPEDKDVLDQIAKVLAKADQC